MPHYWIKTENGKTHGPFTSSQVKQLVTKGELKPHHHLSTDQKKWVAANSVKGIVFKSAIPTAAEQPETELPELGTASRSEDLDPLYDLSQFDNLAALTEDVNPDTSSSSSRVAPAKRFSLSRSKQWCCLIDEQEVGPISTAQLRELATARTLSRSNLVRPANDENWLRAEQIDSLFDRTRGDDVADEMVLRDKSTEFAQMVKFFWHEAIRGTFVSGLILGGFAVLNNQGLEPAFTRFSMAAVAFVLFPLWIVFAAVSARVSSEEHILRRKKSGAIVLAIRKHLFGRVREKERSLRKFTQITLSVAGEFTLITLTDSDESASMPLLQTKDDNRYRNFLAQVQRVTGFECVRGRD